MINEDKEAIRKMKENLRVLDRKVILDLLEDKKNSLLKDRRLSEEEKFRVNYVFNYYKKNPERIFKTSESAFGKQYGKNARYFIDFMEGFN